MMTMSAVERVVQVLTTEDGQKQFLRWHQEPFTQLMLDALRELALPRVGGGLEAANGGVDANACLLELGRGGGANESVAFCVNPSGGVFLQGQSDSRRGMPMPRYGVPLPVKRDENNK
jgi:hypothetical protein